MFSKETMLEHHLRYNHFPPIPHAAEWVKLLVPMLERIEGMGEVFEDFTVAVPGTITPSGEAQDVRASVIIEGLHLHDLVIFTADENFQVEAEDVFGEPEVRQVKTYPPEHPDYVPDDVENYWEA